MSVLHAGSAREQAEGVIIERNRNFSTKCRHQYYFQNSKSDGWGWCGDCFSLVSKYFPELSSLASVHFVYVNCKVTISSFPFLICAEVGIQFSSYSTFKS